MRYPNEISIIAIAFLSAAFCSDVKSQDSTTSAIKRMGGSPSKRLGYLVADFRGKYDLSKISSVAENPAITGLEFHSTYLRNNEIPLLLNCQHVKYLKLRDGDLGRSLRMKALFNWHKCSSCNILNSKCWILQTAA